MFNVSLYSRLPEKSAKTLRDQYAAIADPPTIKEPISDDRIKADRLRLKKLMGIKVKE